MALLAKQEWKLISSPDSLLAQIIKEKYYPNGTFMEAQVGYRPSFAWQSILGAKHIVENGELDPDFRVEILIDSDTGWWNLDLIHSLFDLEDTARIGSRLVQEKGESSGENGGGEVWKAIWSMKLPQCSSLFAGRRRLSLARCVPYVAVDQKPLFIASGDAPQLKRYGKKAPKKIQKLNCDIVDGKGMITFLFEKLDSKGLLEALTVARLIWHRRNDYVFGRGFNSPNKVIVAVRITLESFSLANSVFGRLIEVPGLVSSRWCKPPVGKWKIVRELSGDNSVKDILNSNATSTSTNQDKDRIS
ncbi:uncharacterized protein LOC133879121 [Alnus glutinosa]|uniref:uncharacterized protein LOC133879121 n=1 Tax=Alnus glutinosa TaxID=3517 RepID=UPI002D772BB7|nr:uncharacterized protein LOC133879121 [Alnus glutinosa]